MAHPYFTRAARAQPLGALEEEDIARIAQEGIDPPNNGGYLEFESYIPAYDPYLPSADPLPDPNGPAQFGIVDPQTGYVMEVINVNGGPGGGGGFSLIPDLPMPSTPFDIGPAAMTEVQGGGSSVAPAPAPYPTGNEFFNPTFEPVPSQGAVSTPVQTGGGGYAPVFILPTVNAGMPGAFVGDTGEVLAPPGQVPAKSGGFPWALLLLAAAAFTG